MIAALGLFAFRPGTHADRSTAETAEIAPGGDVRSEHAMVERVRGRTWESEPSLSSEERAILDRLVGPHPERLDDAHGRMRFLERLVAWLQRTYPDSVREELERLLRAAFPEDADELLALFDARESFGKWMDDHQAELVALPADERRRRMWNARRDFFGDDSDELFAAVARNERIADALTQIDEQPVGTPADRFERLREALEAEYGEHTSDFLDRRRQEILDRFVSSDGTQADLAAMTTERRYAELRSIREASGMDEAAIDRWSELDATRDAERASGLEYMAERDALRASLSGDELEAELDGLRRRYFGAALAEIIEGEEGAGYDRFAATQVYGRN